MSRETPREIQRPGPEDFGPSFYRKFWPTVLGRSIRYWYFDTLPDAFDQAPTWTSSVIGGLSPLRMSSVYCKSISKKRFLLTLHWPW